MVAEPGEGALDRLVDIGTSHASTLSFKNSMNDLSAVWVMAFNGAVRQFAEEVGRCAGFGGRRFAKPGELTLIAQDDIFA